MKPFGMIPFFIPHVGCPYVCTFCNQSRITGQSGISHLTPDYIKKTITDYVVKNEMISFGRSPFMEALLQLFIAICNIPY